MQNLRRLVFGGQNKSSLQSELPLSLRNLMLRQQLAEHDACLWMKIGFLSKSSLQMSKMRYYPPL